jgi:myo-inositol-1(or 4)-monophosphatase
MFDRELIYAKKAAIEAGKAIAAYYDKSLDVTYKSPNQPLTQADLEANQIIKEILLDEYPDDGWLSEEDKDTDDRLKKSRVWIVDPLDGTREFIDHNPEFAVSIGLVEDGEAVVGAVYNPITNELFSAAKGSGAYLNKNRIHISTNFDLKNITVLASRSEYKRGEWDVFKDDFKVEVIGGSAYKMGVLAAGKYDACFTLKPKSEWDICGGAIIIQEAGGVILTAKGEPVRFNREQPYFTDLLYSNRYLAKHLLEVIRKRTAA